MHPLLLLLLIPFVASILVWMLPDRFKQSVKTLSLILSLLPALILTLFHQDLSHSEIDLNWFPALFIHFHLAMDPLSTLFVYLTAIIIPFSILAVHKDEAFSPKVYYGFILLVQMFLFGFFLAKDLALFTIFWESMLLPLFFIIHLWGGSARQEAAMKFLVYMIAGSALMVFGVLALFFNESSAGQSLTFNMDSLSKISEHVAHSKWIFAIFLLAFAVKTPLFPFHAWLPDAYCQAPLGGTLLLSAILSKAGIYGILRIGFGFFPTLMSQWSPPLLAFAIFGVLYAALAAWMQNDYKRLIAYSSLSHVNFILAGLFAGTEIAYAGALLQTINHSITIMALFFAAYWLEARIYTTHLTQTRGLAKFMPFLCWITLFFVLASIGLPGLNNFIGEFMILLGLFMSHYGLAALLGTSVILSAVYMLRWMQKVYFEEPSAEQASWIDLNRGEKMLSLFLAAIILWLGVYPSPVLTLIRPIAENIHSTQTPEVLP